MAIDDKKKKSLGRRLGQAAGEKVAMAKLAFGATKNVLGKAANQADAAVGGFVSDVTSGFQEKNLGGTSKQRTQGSGANQGATAGAQTSNPGGVQGSGGGVEKPASTVGNVAPDKSPLQVIPDRVTQQLGQQRGFDTQLTQLGATTGDGGVLPSRGGTFNVASSGGVDPVAQLANFQKQFGGSGEPSSTSEVTGALNSYARERNARLNDPNRQLAQDLDRQMRLGKIAPKNAYRIMQDAIAQSQSDSLGYAKLGAADDINQRNVSFKDRELAGQQGIAQQKLAGDLTTAAADRASRESIALGKRADEASSLALDQAKFAEDSDIKRQRLGLDAEKFQTEQTMEAAKMYQKGNVEGAKNTVARVGKIIDLVSGRQSGTINEQDFMVTLGELGGSDLIRRFYPDFNTEK